MDAKKAQGGSQAEVLRVIEAYARDAQHAADVVAGFLTRWFKSLRLKKPPSLPAEFLLELSAVLRIAAWQRAGLPAVMGEELPPWQQLLGDLVQRLAERPTSFCFDLNACPAPLSKQVVLLWFTRCSWSAMHEIGVDIVVKPADEEAYLHQLVELLWNNRHLSVLEVPVDGRS